MTTSVRLGTLVSPATFRHPSVLAKLAASADEISGGRISVGLGAGWHEREHEAYGFEFPPPGTRMEVLEEQLQVVLGAWGGEPFSFSGRHYQLSDLTALPKPVQQPRIPLIIGGNAGPRSAALAARYADEYNTAFPTLEEIRERRERVAEACARAGRDPIPFSVMAGFLVGKDRGELVGRARRLGERTGLDSEAFLADPPAAWIVGTLDEAVEQLRARKDAGVSRVILQHLLHDDLEAVALIGSELAPALA